MPKALKTQEIREEFIRFFTERGHRHVPSSPLVPRDDPTLLFTSAGMVQFKSMFAAAGNLEYTRATTVQKCFRATDLERVGHTPRHLTFFEMLGNFSFGDYFKRETILWAWEFVTRVLHMDAEKIWVSVYLDDDEASALWQKEVGVPASRIVRLGKKDNFWGPAGSSGACGPCSEIYMDLGAALGCGLPECQPGCDCDRYQEFWNLVFPQFFQDEAGNLSPLPRPGIDTGMGLERLAQILQGVPSVFDIDEWAAMKEAIQDATRVDLEVPKHRVAQNVILEHARALTMLFLEGVYPSNEGRGYVARRILRRAARRGHVLQLTEPFLYRLTGVVVDTYHRAYPELKEGRERIATVCREEEARFLKTLETGMGRFDEVVERTRARGEKAISGRDAFVLYDTFGFPPDMTAEMAEEHGLAVDEEGFRAEMEGQVERSRATARFDHAPGEEAPWEWTGSPQAPHSTYVGYEKLETPVEVRARRRRGDLWEVVLEPTPFYAEGGGQVGDHGWLEGKDGSVLEITGVNKEGDLRVHRGRLVKGDGGPGGSALARVDARARYDTERNHTATHLLHAALKRVVGTHVTQAGSLVALDRLRFDFHHFAPLTPAQMRAVEDDVNRAVLADFDVHKKVTTMDEARQAGATAMFGEKYGERVRQVFVVGEDAKDVSRELCGGCHVRRTGEIGFFRIVSEESVAAGIRRVEAVTGWNAVHRFREEEELLTRVRGSLKAGTLRDLENRVESLVGENEKLRRELSRARSQMLQQSAGDILDQATLVQGVTFLATEFPASDVKALRAAADQLRDRMKSGVGLLAARDEEKVSFVVFVTPDIILRGVDAGKIAKGVAQIVEGGGGGRPDLATSGGKLPEKIPDALRHGRTLLEQMLSAAGR